MTTVANLHCIFYYIKTENALVQLPGNILISKPLQRIATGIPRNRSHTTDTTLDLTGSTPQSVSFEPEERQSGSRTAEDEGGSDNKIRSFLLRDDAIKVVVDDAINFHVFKYTSDTFSVTTLVAANFSTSPHKSAQLG